MCTDTRVYLIANKIYLFFIRKKSNRRLMWMSAMSLMFDVSVFQYKPKSVICVDFIALDSWWHWRPSLLTLRRNLSQFSKNLLGINHDQFHGRYISRHWRKGRRKKIIFGVTCSFKCFLLFVRCNFVLCHLSRLTSHFHWLICMRSLI